ncbi:MAG TPA: SDR family oxidoreductase [Candidatus Paceibacterota bacterium]|nr:SDR family oxidoreductase [Candidatus Paceibacterota bacterium]
MRNERELADKVAVITGAARNMGRAFAKCLAAHGANIVVHHHGPSSLEDASETARAVRAMGVRSIVVEGDLTQVANVEKVFERTFAEFGRADILINGAGLVLKKPLVEVTEEDFDRSFGINAKAAFFMMQQAARRLAPGGRIINLGTTLLGATTANYSVYAGSKAPLEHFTRALAQEVGARGITVNTIAPGPVDTSFYRGQETPESAAAAARRVPAQRLGDVSDIVPLVEFLALPRSQWVTAQTIFINGGYVAR